MRIYRDTCSLQRPLDSKTQIRIVLEAEAVLGVLTLCESGTVELVASDALLFETERNPNIDRREYALAALSQAKTFVALNEQVEKRAKELSSAGLWPLDALHLASAGAAQADYFCTCDDRLLRQAQGLAGLEVQVVSPIELVEAIEP
jgi:predicted nucleic acid-binding protein